MSDLNNLIFGKNPTERIVSIEPKDSSCEIFIQQPSGIVESKLIPNKYWILASKQIDKEWKPLRGNLHYNWFRQFTSLEDFISVKESLKGKDIYFVSDPKESLMIKDGITYFKGMKVQEVSVLAFDIESTGLEHNEDSKVLLIANTFRSPSGIQRKLFSYSDYDSEKEFFDAWCKWVREMNPSIMVGHNIVIYDLPYMAFCANKAGTRLLLGRDNSPINFNKYESKFRKDGSQSYSYNKCRVYGREVIDTFFLALKYDIGRKYDSYKLKQIIKQEGLEVKDRQFYEADKIRDNYRNPIEWEKIKQYAIHDGDDALALYDLMVPSFFYLAQSFPKSFQSIIESASGSQINSFLVRSYLQHAYSLPAKSASMEFEGAISLGNPGIYKHAIKVDVASLYPSIILTYNVYDPNKDPNGHFLLSAKYFTEERLKNKKLAKETGDRYYKDMEQAQKIIINSFYGFMGADGLLFNSPANAAFITQKGRDILQKAIKWAEDNHFTLINADTDSITITQNRELSKVEQEQIVNGLNSLFPNSIRFEHDGYFPNVLVIKIKNYVLDDGTKFKIKGSALKAVNKEKVCQELIHKSIKLLFENDIDGIIDTYHRYILETLDIKDISRWVSKKTVTSKVLNPERTNEQKVLNAISDEEEAFQEGDKIYTYFDTEGNIKLQSQWKNDHDPYKLMEKLYKTILVFSTVLDKKIFINYSLKTKRKLIEELKQKYTK